jgi:hypothetical protein
MFSTRDRNVILKKFLNVSQGQEIFFVEGRQVVKNALWYYLLKFPFSKQYIDLQIN